MRELVRAGSRLAGNQVPVSLSMRNSPNAISGAIHRVAFQNARSWNTYLGPFGPEPRLQGAFLDCAHELFGVRRRLVAENLVSIELVARTPAFARSLTRTRASRGIHITKVRFGKALMCHRTCF